MTSKKNWISHVKFLSVSLFSRELWNNLKVSRIELHCLFRKYFPILEVRLFTIWGQIAYQSIFPRASFTTGTGIVSQRLAGRVVTLSIYPYLALRSGKSRTLSLLPLCVTWHFMWRPLPLPMSWVFIYCLELALLHPISVLYNTPVAFIFISSLLRAFYAVWLSTTRVSSYKVDRWQRPEEQNRKQFSMFCFSHRLSHLID